MEFYMIIILALTILGPSSGLIRKEFTHVSIFETTFYDNSYHWSNHEFGSLIDSNNQLTIEDCSMACLYVSKHERPCNAFYYQEETICRLADFPGDFSIIPFLDEIRNQPPSGKILMAIEDKFVADPMTFENFPLFPTMATIENPGCGFYSGSEVHIVIRRPLLAPQEEGQDLLAVQLGDHYKVLLGIGYIKLVRIDGTNTIIMHQEEDDRILGDDKLHGFYFVWLQAWIAVGFDLPTDSDPFFRTPTDPADNGPITQPHRDFKSIVPYIGLQALATGSTGDTGLYALDTRCLEESNFVSKGKVYDDSEMFRFDSWPNKTLFMDAHDIYTKSFKVNLKMTRSEDISQMASGFIYIIVLLNNGDQYVLGIPSNQETAVPIKLVELTNDIFPLTLIPTNPGYVDFPSMAIQNGFNNADALNVTEKKDRGMDVKSGANNFDYVFSLVVRFDDGKHFKIQSNAREHRFPLPVENLTTTWTRVGFAHTCDNGINCVVLFQGNTNIRDLPSII